MAAKSDIEWTNSSWTPIRARNRKTRKVGWHCEHASTGCEFCYAEGLNKWFGTGLLFKPGHRKDIEIFLDEEMLTAPLRWKRPRMVFCCSMTDLFADFVPDEWIDKLFAVMALCPQHTFQVLTKRAERMRDYVASLYKTSAWIFTAGQMIDRGLIPPGLCIQIKEPLPNIWLGVSCERQQEADERIPLLLETPAAVRFISAEPLLAAVDLTTIKFERVYGTGLLNALTGEKRGHVPNSPLGSGNHLDWVIVGGESGPHARPMHPDWARGLRDQCEAAGVPYFFKQWGEYRSINIMSDASDSFVHERVGKKAAGRLLDGRKHNEFPSSAT